MGTPPGGEAERHAVGVEATWRQLQDAGCDLAQGHHLGRPMPAEQLEAWFATVRSGVPA